MAANLLEKTVEQMIHEWGFGTVATDQLFEHANNVISLKNCRVGEIVVGLGLSDKETVERLIADKPSHVKTLAYLQENIRALATRVDQVLSVQSQYPYISRKIPNVNIHPAIGTGQASVLLRDEMNRYDMVALACGDALVMLFNDFEKMMHFKSLGKAERMKSVVYTTFADEAKSRADRVEFHYAVAESSVYLHYHQQLTDAGQGQTAIDDGLQTISHSEGKDDRVMNLIVQILNEAISKEINDVAIEPDGQQGRAVVKFRRDQRLIPSGIMLAPEDREAVTRLLMARSKANPAGGRLRHPADGNLNFEGKTGQAFLRMSFIPLEESQLPMTSVSMRILPKTAKAVELSSLGISPVVLKELRYYSKRKKGLFVVCGPTGSGKSTTLAGMIDSHYKEFGGTQKRLSVEQPVERIMPGVLHIDVSQHHYTENELPAGADKFSMALRAILRHDPDLVLVGEVRDKESCMVSIDAANTGHLVLTTTHANDPVLGYRRMASFLDKERRFDLVQTLEGILAQRLLPKLCQFCSEKKPITEVERDELRPYALTRGIDINTLVLPQFHMVQSREGCEECNHQGIKGMVAVHGLLTMNPTVRELLLSPSEGDWMKADSASDSKVTLFSSALESFNNGVIDLETLML